MIRWWQDNLTVGWLVTVAWWGLIGAPFLALDWLLGPKLVHDAYLLWFPLLVGSWFWLWWRLLMALESPRTRKEQARLDELERARRAKAGGS